MTLPLRTAASTVWLAMMKIDILTLFPEICRAPLSESMMKRAQENGIVDLRIYNLRDWTTDKHHVVDDAPFGGGQGMVMKPEPILPQWKISDIKHQTSNIKHRRFCSCRQRVVVLINSWRHNFRGSRISSLFAVITKG